METGILRAAWPMILLTAVVTGCPSFAAVSAEASSPRVKVEPRPSDELFANPGRGWQTFHRLADDAPNLQGIASASAYFRFYWRGGGTSGRPNRFGQVRRSPGARAASRAETGLSDHVRRLGLRHGGAGLAEGAGLQRGRVHLRRRQALGAGIRRPSLPGNALSEGRPQAAEMLEFGSTRVFCQRH